jgi:hypothetical protein
MSYLCRNNHLVRGPRDRLTDGSCRFCSYERQRRYRQRVKEAVQIVRYLEEQAQLADEQHH